MYRALILIAVFLVVFYVITFIRIRKKRKEREALESVKGYQYKYRLQKPKRAHETDALFDGVKIETESVDFLDKEEFFQSVQKETAPEGKKETTLKRKQFRF